MKPVVLLDLNQTLVDAERDAVRLRPFELHIEHETYRQWLVEHIRDTYVILLTARPKKYQAQTLKHIEDLTGWTPQEAYFAEINSYPHVKKEHLLRKYVLTKHKKVWMAIESNPKTRAIFAKYDIDAYPLVSDAGDILFKTYDPLPENNDF